MHHAILLSLLFTLLPPSSSGLTLFFTNTSTTPPSNGYLELPSVYATIGTLPFTNITYHEITIIDHDTCHLGGDNNDHRNELMGKVMVFTGDLLFSMFSHCNNAHQANGVAVARLAQRAGAVAVVIRAFDQVCTFYFPIYTSFILKHSPTSPITHTTLTTTQTLSPFEHTCDYQTYIIALHSS